MKVNLIHNDWPSISNSLPTQIYRMLATDNNYHFFLSSHLFVFPSFSYVENFHRLMHSHVRCFFFCSSSSFSFSHFISLLIFLLCCSSSTSTLCECFRWHIFIAMCKRFILMYTGHKTPQAMDTATVLIPIKCSEYRHSHT